MVSEYAEIGVRECGAGRSRIVCGLIVTGRANVYIVSCRNATLMVTVPTVLGGRFRQVTPASRGHAQIRRS